MTTPEQSDWVPLQLPGLIAPGTVSKLQGGVQGTVRSDGVVIVDELQDALVLTETDLIDPGTTVTIRLRSGHPVCKPTAAIEQDQERRTQANQNRRERREAQQAQTRQAFWNQYEIPVTFTTAQNNRLSELSRGSTGTGATANTVRHFLVLEDFTDGRLKRQAGRFLCKGEGKYSDPSMGLEKTDPATLGESTPEITCSTCLKRMERWKTEAGLDRGDGLLTDGGTTSSSANQIRCGNCGRFAGVKYEWRGPSYAEVIHCDHCEGRAFQYDPFAAAIADMSDEEVRELVD